MPLWPCSWQLLHSDLGEDARVLVNNFTYTLPVPFCLFCTFVLHVGTAVGRWTCNLQVAGSNPGWSTFT